MEKSNRSEKKQTLLQSFKVAFAGLADLAKNERNFRIHLVFAFLALLLCLLLGVSSMEWIVVIILIVFVLSAEAVNTCFETLCDLVSPEYHPQVKKIKDISAGMVLLGAIASVVIAGIIFLPYIICLL